MSVATAAMHAAAEAVSALPMATRDRPAFDYRPPRRPPRRTLAGTVPPLSGGPTLSEALAAIDARNAELRAFAAVDRNPPGDGPLVSVKDLIHTAGLPTVGGSNGYRSPSERPKDGTAIARLREAGFRIIGKTETHEFGLGVTTPQSRNPHDPTRLAGGSSGGAAISVAADMCWAAVATDTRASIRVPSALCGLVGFKPTYGHIPTDELISLSWSIDHLGAIGRDVAAAVQLADVLAASNVAAAWRARVDGLRVGVPAAALDACEEEVVTAFQHGLDGLRALGADVVEAERPSASDLERANHAGLLLSRCEAAAWHRSAGTDLARCSRETGDQLRAALETTAVDYLDAQRCRRRLADDLLAAALDDDLDAWALPTVPVVAPPAHLADQYLMILSRNAVLWSFTGFPALSLPAPTTGMPVGFQVVAPPGEDATLVALASMLETVWER